MDGFTYTNIFETKGIEYIIVIAFLLMIIPFWLAINRKSAIVTRLRNTVGVLTAAILRIPEGLYFNRNHTWTFLEKNGTAKLGVDDFLLHVTGEIKLNPVFSEGDMISKGDIVMVAEHNGKVLRFCSPVSGEVTGTNPLVSGNPGALFEDPYNRGWVYKIKPTDWKADTGSLLIAGEAIAWTMKEIDRLKVFLANSTRKFNPEMSIVELQDGGELIDQPLAGLPEEVWQDFQSSFLN